MDETHGQLVGWPWTKRIISLARDSHVNTALCAIGFFFLGKQEHTVDPYSASDLL